MHEGYLAAGADLVETDTFGGTRIVLAEYGLEDRVREINATADLRRARPARSCSVTARPAALRRRLDGPRHEDHLRHRWVNFDQVTEAYAEQTAGLLEGGSDVLFLETQQDTLNVKAALIGIDVGFARAWYCCLLIVLSGFDRDDGDQAAGQSIEAVYVPSRTATCSPWGSTAPLARTSCVDDLRTLSDISRFPVSCFPNAGLPDEEGKYNETPEAWSARSSASVARDG